MALICACSYCQANPVPGESEPQIGVRVGPILVLVADRAALDSFVNAWRQAEEMAVVAFPR